MLILSRTDYEAILAHAERHVPNEACGLLAGLRDGVDKIVRKVYFLNNIDGSPTHFSMAAEEQFTAVADMRKAGIVLLGNFHSHPATPSRPSAEDKRLAFDSSMSYVIVSLAAAQPVVKSFHITAAAATEEELEIREEQAHV